MVRRVTCLFLIFTLFQINQRSFSQKIDSTSLLINPRLSFYSFEKTGEMILHVPPKLRGSNINTSLRINGKEVGSWKGMPGKKLILIPFTLDLIPGNYSIDCELISSGGSRFKAKTVLTVLFPKDNEVKTDRFTGGLIVNGRIFFPFGFYCYSPVHPTLHEEEAVKGFNMMSPYQKILPETFSERKEYMDRCARLGMKVHYNLLSVSGGGGVSSKIDGITEDEKRKRLIAEITAFRDHPALLAWYISDEPTGNKITPEELEDVYRTVKENDPWHPVSIVFMAPFLSSKKYENAVDIVMADPYPVPNSPITQVGTIAGQLRSEFEGRKPVWIVPQAFGGGEWWGREPSIQEIRSMTYLSIINGARGIQYFIRQGLNSFPKSTASWNECGRMALEIAEITPWLLSDEDPIPIRTNSSNIQVTSAVHDGQLLIIVVNKVNAPQKADLSIAVSTVGKARVLFENREISMSGGSFSDYIAAYGSQVYLINIKPLKKEVLTYRGNLVTDPGFEDMSSPGVPASCYAWNEGDRGATYFLDSREHFEANHSLRMVTPEENKGSRLRFFPVKINIGRTYIISIRAKTDIEPGNPAESNIRKDNSTDHNPNSTYFEIGLGEFGNTRFYPGSEWQEFVTSVTIPEEIILPSRTNVILRLPGEGTAWFDMLQVFEAVDIFRSINPELQNEWSYE